MYQAILRCHASILFTTSSGTAVTAVGSRGQYVQLSSVYRTDRGRMLGVALVLYTPACQRPSGHYRLTQHSEFRKFPVMLQRRRASRAYLYPWEAVLSPPYSFSCAPVGSTLYRYGPRLLPCALRCGRIAGGCCLVVLRALHLRSYRRIPDSVVRLVLQRPHRHYCSTSARHL